MEKTVLFLAFLLIISATLILGENDETLINEVLEKTTTNEVFADPMAMPKRRRSSRKRRRSRGRSRSRSRSRSNSRSRSRSGSKGRSGSRSRSRSGSRGGHGGHGGHGRYW